MLTVPAHTLSIGLLRHMIDSSRDAFMVVEASEMTLVDIDHNACQLLGYKREEMIGQPVTYVECSLQDLFFWEDLKAAPHFDGVRILEGEWLTKDGASFPVEKRVSSYSEAGVIYWVIHAEDLTRRRKIEAQQEFLAAQLQSALEATAEGIMVVDLDGNIININRRFAQMWLLPDELRVNRHAREMIRHVLSLLSNQAVFATTLEKIEDNAEVETEDILMLIDGRFIACISKPEFLRDRLTGRVFSVRDITAMKRVESELVAARDAAEQASQAKTQMLEALSVSESRMRRLVNSSLISIIQGDRSWRLTDANDVFLQIAGFNRQALEKGAIDWLDLNSPQYHAQHRRAMNELETKGVTAPFESELIRRDGTLVPMMLGMAKLEDSDDEWVGFVLDLTEQRRLELIKSEFISVVSHELRTPLTSIRGSLGLLEGGLCGELPPKALQLIHIAHKNSQRLGGLVNDILDMEKLASGKVYLDMQRVDLVALTLQSIEANAGYAEALKVKYVLSEHPQQAWIMADINRLMQIFANLLSNAAKFSPKDGQVEIRLISQKDAYLIEVEDHGAGIPLAFRDRIFGKFAQAESKDTRQQGGTGLGLNITQTLVEKMGGRIGFRSEEGVGTLFWFTLMSDEACRDALEHGD